MDIDADGLTKDKAKISMVRRTNRESVASSLNHEGGSMYSSYANINKFNDHEIRLPSDTDFEGGSSDRDQEDEGEEDEEEEADEADEEEADEADEEEGDEEEAAEGEDEEEGDEEEGDEEDAEGEEFTRENATIQQTDELEGEDDYEYDEDEGGESEPEEGFEEDNKEEQDTEDAAKPIEEPEDAKVAEDEKLEVPKQKSLLQAGTDIIGNITAPIIEGKPQNLFKQSTMMDERQALIKQKEEEDRKKFEEEQAKAKEQEEEEQIVWEDIMFKQIETNNNGVNLKENHQVLV